MDWGWDWDALKGVPYESVGWDALKGVPYESVGVRYDHGSEDTFHRI